MTEKDRNAKSNAHQLKQPAKDMETNIINEGSAKLNFNSKGTNCMHSSNHPYDCSSTATSKSTDDSTERDSCYVSVEDKPVSSKPPYSYIALIAMAIRDSPRKMATLAEINAYLTEKYAFFRGTYKGWRNSIRHNLSLNECFVKILRDPKRPWAKDNYWILNPSSEYTFADGVFSRRRKRLNNDNKGTGSDDGKIQVNYKELSLQKTGVNDFSIESILKKTESKTQLHNDNAFEELLLNHQVWQDIFKNSLPFGNYLPSPGIFSHEYLKYPHWNFGVYPEFLNNTLNCALGKDYVFNNSLHRYHYHPY